MDGATDARPLGARALSLQVALGAALVADVGAVGARLRERGLLDRIEQGGAAADEIATSDDLVAATSGFALLLTAVGAVLALIWLWRVYRGLGALGADGLRYGPHWVWLGWIIPILSWWRPYQLVGDTWRESAAAGEARGTETPRWLPLWWAGWLAYIVFSQIASGVDDGTIEGMRGANLADIVAGVALLVAGIPFLLLVRGVSSGYEARRAAAAAAAATDGPDQPPTTGPDPGRYPFPV